MSVIGAVEKLFLAKFAKMELHQDGLRAIFSDGRTFFPNVGRLEQKASFSTVSIRGPPASCPDR
jgi:hypothetical protein